MSLILIFNDDEKTTETITTDTIQEANEAIREKIDEGRTLLHLINGDELLNFEVVNKQLLIKVNTLSNKIHVDDYIENYSANKQEEKYARWFFHLNRLGAILQNDFSEYIDQYKLFCTYQGKCYRVTGASRLGDIWLSRDYSRNHGYDLRVWVNEVTNFSKEPTDEQDLTTLDNFVDDDDE